MVRKVGYYTPFLLVGVILSSIGAGLLYTLRVDTPQSQWVGYQVLYGLGLGCSMPAPKLAAQTVLPERDVSVGVAVMFFSQLLGGAIFVPVGQNVLQDQLTQRLSSVPGFDAQTITQNSVAGVTDLPDTMRLTVLTAYNDSLRRVFLVGLILACLAIIPTLAMEWCSMKQENEESEHDETSAGKSLN
jgi:MFS family permease